MTRDLLPNEERIVRKLTILNGVWPKSLKLFADNGTLLLIDAKTGEVLVSKEIKNILCDGGDPDHGFIDGVEFLNPQ